MICVYLFEPKFALLYSKANCTGLVEAIIARNIKSKARAFRWLRNKQKYTGNYSNAYLKWRTSWQLFQHTNKLTQGLNSTTGSDMVLKQFRAGIWHFWFSDLCFWVDKVATHRSRAARTMLYSKTTTLLSLKASSYSRATTRLPKAWSLYVLSTTTLPLKLNRIFN